MTNLPLITIVIPSFNKEKFIGATLESIVKQKYPKVEVIIQDGGSTDATLNVVRRYQKKYPAVFKLEAKKDNGQLDAVTKGLKKAHGDILTFINADDCYEEEVFYKIAAAYINNSKALWFAGRGIVVDSNDNEIAKPVTMYKNLLYYFNTYTILQIVNYLIQPSVFFTKEAYKSHGPFTGTVNFITEYDFWLKLGRIQMPVRIDSITSRFRIEPGTKTMRMFDSLLKEDEKIIKKYTNNFFVLGLHKLNNLGRVIVGRYV